MEQTEMKQNNKKIKVLVVPSDRTGVSYFRSTNPHIALETKYPDDFHVDIDYDPKLYDDVWLKQYDIIHYHRNLGDFDKMEELLNRIESLGIVSIMDIDDYWAPGSHHPSYYTIKKYKLDEKILQAIKIAKNILTTTPIFADEIKKYNKNVFVVPNAIDLTEKQYISNPTESDKLRIGWLGGSSHMHDLEILRGVVSKLKSANLIDKIQFVLCGFDVRGTNTHYNESTGEKEVVNITPKQSIWYEYEKIFTDNYSIVSPEYKKHLMKFTTEEFKGIENESYRRVWTKPISSYATNYNLFDVSLAPLAENTFNKMKSQLKVIEAGFHKKAIIAQNFGPYTLDLENAIEYGGLINDKGNGVLITTRKNSKDWVSAIKKMINSPELVEQLQTNLHNSVKDMYSLEAVSDTRKDLYIKLIK